MFVGFSNSQFKMYDAFTTIQAIGSSILSSPRTKYHSNPW